MRPVHILLVEDNEGDIMLTLEALNAGKIFNKVTVLQKCRNNNTTMGITHPKPKTNPNPNC